MNLASNISTGRERRLDEAIASYLAALDAGAAPTAEDWLAEHSDLAPELESFLRQYRQIDELANPLRRAAESMGSDTPDATHPDNPSPARTPDPGPTTTSKEPSASIPGGPIGPASLTVGRNVAETRGSNDRDEDPDPSLPSGDRVRYFGDYELIRELGRGGMGVVYKARQVSLNRPVALKMIRAGALSSDGELRRFRNEAEAVALLDHPRIVPIFEVGSHRGQGYYTMRLVAGPSLADRLDPYRGRYTTIARLVGDLAEAINHAHCRGVLHRDLKPANVLIDEHGAAHVTDFGLAKRLEGDSELTHTGAILGTPAYMAPEQASGRRGAVTTATDVYGMGAILYALLTGHAPFEGEGVAETLDLVRNQPPEPPRAADFRIPQDLEVICLKCLEKEPARRYPTAAALAEDLRRFAAGEPIAARAVGPLERAWLWCRRNRAVATLGALFVTALVLGAIASATFAFLAHREAISAKRERDQSEGLRYVSEINAAFRDLEGDAIETVRRRLADLVPRDPSQTDRRGFEWHLLQALCSQELRVFRDPSPLQSLAFSPDGRRLATAGWIGPVRLWDSATGKELNALRGFRRVQVLEFSPDGRKLAGWVKAPSLEITDYSAKLWDTGPGHRSVSLGSSEHAVYSLAFEPDGRRVATAGSDGTVRLWDTTTGRELVRLRASEDAIHSVAFAPHGRLLAVGVEDGRVQLWDPDEGRELTALRGHTSPVGYVVFSPDGRRLASTDTDGNGRLWDVASGREVASLGRSSRLTFSADGHRLATIAEVGVVQIRDAGTGQFIIALRGPGEVTSVAFSPDGHQLATATGGGTVRLWDTEAARELAVFPAHDGPVVSLAFSPDGRCLATASIDGTARIWDAAIGDSWDVLRGHSGEVMALAFAPDGRRLASVGADSTLRVWDADSALESLVVRGLEGSIRSVAFSPDGRCLVTAERDAARVRDAETGRVLLELHEPKGPVVSAVFSPDGQSLATSGEGAVRLWDPSTGRERFVLRVLEAGFISIAFSSDSRWMATAAHHKLWLWETRSGREVLVLRDLKGSAMSIAFSPGGWRLATAGASGTARVWGLEVGEEILSVSTSNRTLNAVTLSPDGGRLATAGSEGAVQIWDAATGREFFAFRSQSVRANSVSFSPDGRRLAVAYADGKIRLWNASTSDDASRASREAVGLVRFALSKAGSELEVRQRISGDGTVSDEVRKLALEQAGRFWRAHLRAKAQGINELLFSRLHLREDVLAALHADKSSDPAVLAEARSQAACWAQSPETLSDASRAIADEPGREPAEYQRALRLAEAACRASSSFRSLFALGVAQYRAGYPRDALATLERAVEKYRREIITTNHSEFVFFFDSDVPRRDTGARSDGPLSGAALPPDLLAYQAMAHQRLGAIREARTALDRLREHFKVSLTLGDRRRTDNRSGYAHSARRSEAEALVLGLQSHLPADVFNP